MTCPTILRECYVRAVVRANVRRGRTYVTIKTEMECGTAIALTYRAHGMVIIDDTEEEKHSLEIIYVSSISE